MDERVALPVSMVTLGKCSSLQWLYRLKSFSVNFRGIEKGGSFFKTFAVVIQLVQNHCAQ